jgi:hypothetical protein
MIAMISQPMKNKSVDEINKEREDLAKVLEEQGYDVLDTVLSESDVKEDDPLYYLAKSIEFLAEADIIVFMKGWEEARGCRIEHQIAKEYNKEIMEL